MGECIEYAKTLQVAKGLLTPDTARAFHHAVEERRLSKEGERKAVSDSSGAEVTSDDRSLKTILREAVEQENSESTRSSDRGIRSSGGGDGGSEYSGRHDSGAESTETDRGGGDSGSGSSGSKTRRTNVRKNRRRECTSSSSPVSTSDGTRDDEKRGPGKDGGAQPLPGGDSCPCFNTSLFEFSRQGL